MVRSWLAGGFRPTPINQETLRSIAFLTIHFLFSTTFCYSLSAETQITAPLKKKCLNWCCFVFNVSSTKFRIILPYFVQILRKKYYQLSDSIKLPLPEYNEGQYLKNGHFRVWYWVFYSIDLPLWLGVTGIYFRYLTNQKSMNSLIYCQINTVFSKAIFFWTLPTKVICMNRHCLFSFGFC